MKAIVTPLLGFLIWMAQAASAQTNYVLGETSIAVGPSAGTNTVTLGVTPANGAWAATTNSPWLHLSLANQSGVGSTNVSFSYDANSGGTRNGTLTVAGLILAVTQAGSTYTNAGSAVILAGSNFWNPQCVAVDRAGNIYFSPTPSTIFKWIASNDTVSTLVPSGVNSPAAVTVDGVGNVYIADTGNGAIKEWIAASNNLVTLVSSGLVLPRGLAVDGAGDVYFADTSHSSLKEWMSSNSVITLESGLTGISSLAVDVGGNVYVSAEGLYEWVAASSNLTTLVSPSLYGARCLSLLTARATFTLLAE